MSICVPKLTFGAEIWTPTDASMSAMECFHSQMGRQIQGLCPNVSGPASFCLLGWDSIETLFDIAKLMYVLRLLMHTSAYKRVALDRLTESRFGQETQGPCAELWKVIVKHNMDGYVKRFLGTVLMSKAR